MFMTRGSTSKKVVKDGLPVFFEGGLPISVTASHPVIIFLVFFCQISRVDTFCVTIPTVLVSN